MALPQRVNYPKFLMRTNFKLLSFVEVGSKWNEANQLPGVRFGGVGMLRVQNSAHMQYVFVAGNEIPDEICPLHHQKMDIERVTRDTDHNIEMSVFYKCTVVDIDNNGDNIRCGDNVWPCFPREHLLQLMRNPIVAQRPHVVRLV